MSFIPHTEESPLPLRLLKMEASMASCPFIRQRTSLFDHPLLL